MKWFHSGIVVVALCTSVGTFWGSAALAQPSSGPASTSRFVGTWQLNVQQSKQAPGEQAPASLVTEISRVDSAHVHWTTTITDAKGQKDVETFDTPGNGDFYSISGTTMVAHRISPTILQSTFKEDDGLLDQVTCTLSSNANQMTCNGLITNSDGTTAQYLDVFDRR